MYTLTPKQTTDSPEPVVLYSMPYWAAVGNGVVVGRTMSSM